MIFHFIFFRRLFRQPPLFEFLSPDAAFDGHYATLITPLFHY